MNLCYFLAWEPFCLYIHSSEQGEYDPRGVGEVAYILAANVKKVSLGKFYLQLFDIAMHCHIIY